MKLFKKMLSLLLVLSMVLTWVCVVPIAVNAAASDYIATSYAANLKVETTKAAGLRTYPNGSANAKYTVPMGTMLSVKALHKGTDGGYWYEVLFYTETLYVDATTASLAEHLTGDVTIADVQSPASLAYGASFSIQGDISSTLNDIGTVTATMYTSTNITKVPYMSSSDEVNGKSYSLLGSGVDAGLAFGSMAAGVYTYVLTAEAVSYYIDGGALATSVQTVVLNTQQCVVTDWRNPNDDLAFGIDVSTWNGSINWSKTKDVIDFAILRIGFSETLDNRFLEYATACETYDIPYGVYHYSYALTVADVIDEAKFVINTLDAYGYNPELPVWYDLEDASQAALGSAMLEKLVTAFCDTIAEAGYQPGFYGFTSWFSSSYQDGYLSSLPQWIAQIDGFSSNGTATYDGGTWLWQYSWEGSISGISGDVDCNLCYADFPGVTSDTSYLAKCTQYPIHAIGTTSDPVNLRQYPHSSYTSYGLTAAGTEVEVTGLYKNAAGEYWYQVRNGSTYGYMYASYVTIDEFLYDDLAVIDPTMASSLSVGSGYFLEGKLVSQYNTIYTTYAKMYSGEDVSASPVLSSKYTNNSKKYNLLSSTVCDNMLFGSLSAGYYTYEISADVVSYYYSGGSLASKTENVVLWTAPVNVGSVSVTPPATMVCSHNIVTDAGVAATCTSDGLSDGSHCSKCGIVLETQEVIPATGHNYKLASTTPANCEDYEVYHLKCANCGDSYSVDAGELAAGWLESIPAGMDASLFKTKTQYRYSDYETVTSSAASMPGYTLKSSAWEQSGTGSVDYVNSWPSGFSTYNSLYSQYNKKSAKVTASETATTKTEVNSDKVTGYLYYHWCYSNSYYSLAYSSGSYTTFHAYYSTTNPSNYNCDTSDMSYCTYHSSCSNSDWWFVAEVYTQSYTNYQKVNTYEHWTDFSAWSDTAVTASNTRKVETRTLYQLKEAPALGSHVWSNGKCTACGATCSHSWSNSKCTVCGMNCSHSWSNGKCSTCGISCSHSWSNGKCSRCGISCSHSWSNGKCSTCGIACSHSWNNGVCTTCGMGCAHIWVNGTCSTCGLVCGHNYVDGICSVCGGREPAKDYYLFGYIN
ncbi:MAG: SH3 domain-containing protein, partial [Oscillospiraceae bacterium]|nr:SH3 domain-containing protein [Oscillospiraceae bacterium]